MKKIFSAGIGIFVLLLSVAVCAQSQYFIDINECTQQELIDELYEMNLVEGLPGGTFEPDRKVTRAEFCEMMYRISDFSEKTENISFPDVNENEWYFKSVSALSNAGIVNGFEDGLFHPDECITNEQAIKIAVEIFEYNCEIIYSNTAATYFTDYTQIADWAKGYIHKACDIGCIISSDEDVCVLKPKGNTTRAKSAELMFYLYNSIDAWN